ncbi:MAG: co-chaperone GroES [Pseudomonadota bacterium]
MKDKKFQNRLNNDRDQPSFDDSNEGGRPMRRLHPLGLRVVARIVKDSNVTDGGLYLPEGAKEAAQESVLAQVIEVASAVDTRTEEETNISGIPLGSMVLIPKAVGVKVPWDDSLRIIDTREILALVDEIRLT